MLPYLDRNFEAYASGQFFERVHGVSGRELAVRAERGDEGPSRSSPSSAATSARRSRPFATPSTRRSSSSAGRSAGPSGFPDRLWQTFETYAYSIAKERLKIDVSEVENVAVLGAAALYFDAKGAEVSLYRPRRRSSRSWPRPRSFVGCAGPGPEALRVRRLDGAEFGGPSVRRRATSAL